MVPGVRLEEVTDALGEPTDRSSEPPLILVYGPLQLTFRQGELVLAAYYAGRGNVEARVAADVPETQEAVEALLVAEGAAFTNDPALSYDDYTSLQVHGSGASVSFEAGSLLGVQVPTGSA